MVEVLIVVMIVAIVAALGFSLIGLLKGGDKGSDKMFKSLVTRITLSIILFGVVMVSGFMGWISPNINMIDKQIVVSDK